MQVRGPHRTETARIFKAMIMPGIRLTPAVGRTILVCVGCIAVFGNLLLFPRAVLAASLTILPDRGQPGSSLAYSGSGFAPDKDTWVFFDKNKNGTRELGEPTENIKTDANGDIPEGSITVPQVPAGDYQVLVDVEKDDTTEASATFTVVPVLYVSPVSGVAGSQTQITTASRGFAKDSSGVAWFDSNANNVLDDGEPSTTIYTNNTGGVTAGTPLSVPQVSAGVYAIRADVPSGGDIEASTNFEVLPGIEISPETGIMDTVTTITVTGGSFDHDTEGYVWFDTNNDGVMDTEEPQAAVTSTSSGELPAGTSLSTPLLPPNGTYRVRADIPAGGDIESSAIFKTDPVTTSIIVTRYDAHGVVVSRETRTWQELQSGMTVYGDDSTHFYLQGISGDTGNPWDPTETINIKDWGTNQGTDVRDICELVGGMAPGDVVEMVASDGWSKTYDYELVYEPDPRQGRILLCWRNIGSNVPDFYEGMRLVFAADDYCFGNQDQHDCFPQSRWYFYSENQPTTTGHSGKYIYRINIYEPNLYTCDSGGTPVGTFGDGETVYVTGEGLDASTSYTLWVQPEPVDTRFNSTLVAGDDPSGSQEPVTTDGNGDFGPEAVWTIDAGESGTVFDIIADNQAAGTVGVFDANDAIDNPGWQGMEVMGFISFTITDYNGDGVSFGPLDPETREDIQEELLKLQRTTGYHGVARDA